MENPASALPKGARVKILSSKSGPALEERINFWLEHNSEGKSIFSVTVSPKGSRVYAVITYAVVT